jgi:hypothetical protein
VLIYLPIQTDKRRKIISWFAIPLSFWHLALKKTTGLHYFLNPVATCAFSANKVKARQYLDEFD